MAKFTITFDEKVKGFTSFHSYIPDWMGSMNSNFYSINDGQLYIHNDEGNTTRNNFYGVQFTSKVTYILNESPSVIKVIKTLNTESNKALDATIRSYLNDETTAITESTIANTEFKDKEGKQHAYVRRNELAGDLSSKSTYGIGRVASVLGSIITFTTVVPTSLISEGDSLLDAAETVIGIIQSHTGNTVIVDTTPTIAANTFMIGTKNGRIEGSEIRGYNFEITLTDNTTTRTELFAASSELFKSEPL